MAEKTLSTKLGKALKLAHIRTDGGTQPRVQLSEEAVADYAEALSEGAQLPPVTVYFDGSEYWLADGFHRFHAHRKIDALQILADVREGTRRDAVLHSVGANAAHGLRRSNADKRQAVETLLKDAEWSGWSNREIARACGVSDVFVGKVRESLTANVCSDATPVGRTYTTKHGTEAVMKTAEIGRKGEREKAPSETASKPTAPAAPAPKQTDPTQEYEDQEPDLLAELEDAARQIAQQDKLIKSLSSSDLAQELADWQQRFSQLEGRLRQEMTTRSEAEKQARYYGDILKKIRKAIGVDQTQQILPRLRELLEGAA
jgi:hypothetical protein